MTNSLIIHQLQLIGSVCLEYYVENSKALVYFQRAVID